jgi:hypothetical protein
MTAIEGLPPSAMEMLKLQLKPKWTKGRPRAGARDHEGLDSGAPSGVRGPVRRSDRPGYPLDLRSPVTRGRASAYSIPHEFTGPICAVSHQYRHKPCGAPMTSHDHYRIAEQFAEEAYNELRHDDEAGAMALAAIAQVHATLALSAPAGKGPPGLGQSEAADIQSTGTAHQDMPEDSRRSQERTPPPPSPGDPSARRPRRLPPRLRGDQPEVPGSRDPLPPGEVPVRPVALDASPPFVRTGDPSQPPPGPVTGQPGPDDPGTAEPGDLGDQKLRGPEEQKPGGISPGP